MAPAIGGKESNPEFPPKEGILDFLPDMSTCFAIHEKPEENKMDQKCLESYRIPDAHCREIQNPMGRVPIKRESMLTLDVITSRKALRKHPIWLPMIIMFGCRREARKHQKA